MPRVPTALAAGLAALFVVAHAAAAARAGEEDVPLDKVPKAVLDAVKKRFPKGEPKEASKETEGDKTVYEVTVMDGKQHVDVTLTPDGAITTLEKTIDPKDLPKAVTDGIEKKYPKAAYKIAEEVVKVTDGKEELDYYEALLETADKKKVEVEVAADGTIKKEEDKAKEKDEKDKDKKDDKKKTDK